MFKNKKSQMAMTDLLIALFIAFILIIIIVFAWNRYLVILEEDNEYKKMQIIAFQTADLLIKSKGEPVNWEEGYEAEVIGLANSDRDLSVDKVNAFINLSYGNASKTLGLEFYDFYFQLKYINGTSMVAYGEVPSNTVVNIQRLVLYEDEKAIVEFALWK